MSKKNLKINKCFFHKLRKNLKLDCVKKLIITKDDIHFKITLSNYKR